MGYDTENNDQRFTNAGFTIYKGKTMNINFEAPYGDLAKEIHQFNVDKGWWDDYLDDKTKRLDLAYMLVVSELSEAMEGCRKDLMDDKLPHRKMFDVELADAVIRLLDMAGAYGVGLDALEILGTEPMENIPSSKPVQLWQIVKGLGVRSEESDSLAITGAMYMILQVCSYNNIDLRQIMKEKMEYNATRADHLRENRVKAGGKKF